MWVRCPEGMSFLSSVWGQTGFGAHSLSCIIIVGMKLTTDLHPMQRLRTTDVHLPSPPLPSPRRLHGVVINEICTRLALPFILRYESSSVVSFRYLFWKIKVGLWDRLAVCVSVCVFTLKILKASTNLYETWYIHHATWGHLNGIIINASHQ
jgi:hypothetical protein